MHLKRESKTVYVTHQKKNKFNHNIKKDVQLKYKTRRLNKTMFVLKFGYHNRNVLNTI